MLDSAEVPSNSGQLAMPCLLLAGEGTSVVQTHVTPQCLLLVAGVQMWWKARADDHQLVRRLGGSKTNFTTQIIKICSWTKVFSIPS